MVIKFEPSKANTGAPSVKTGRKTKTICWSDGTPLEAGDIKAGQAVTFEKATGKVLKPKKRKP